MNDTNVHHVGPFIIISSCGIHVSNSRCIVNPKHQQHETVELEPGESEMSEILYFKKYKIIISRVVAHRLISACAFRTNPADSSFVYPNIMGILFQFPAFIKC
jgi:hypothetical protein